MTEIVHIHAQKYEYHAQFLSFYWSMVLIQISQANLTNDPFEYTIKSACLVIVNYLFKSNIINFLDKAKKINLHFAACNISSNILRIYVNINEIMYYLSCKYSNSQIY